MSRILFDAFDAAPVALAIAASIADDFSAAVAVNATPQIVSSIAVDISGDFSAAITAQAVGSVPVVFVPPSPGDPRVATVTHRN